MGKNRSTEKKVAHQLDLENEGTNFISEKTHNKLNEIIAKSPSLEQDEINFLGLSVKKHQKSNLTAIMLLRNGTNKDVTFKQIPLEVKDASNDVVAKGTFKLEGLTVKANTSKPATFTFPYSAILKENINLSQWQIHYYS